MSVVVIGVDHRSASLDLLEKVAVQGERLNDALELLRKSDHIAESVVLSTCMRTEIYVDAVRFHPAVDDVISLLAQISATDRELLSSQLFQHHDQNAYAHLFRVASGLESAVLGESEVLGQVARAWEHARAEGACRSVLGALFRHAVGVGKRARTETSIARGITSIGQAAVVMAQQALGSLDGCNAVVVGAGEMGQSMTHTLRRIDNLGGIAIVNRTVSRAEELARQVGASSGPLEAFPELFAQADVVFTSTGAPECLISAEMVNEALKQRPERPMVLVDLAVPRDVDSEAAKIEGVTVLDLDDLRAFTAQGHAERGREAITVETIVDEEVRLYCADANARLVAPVVAGLHEHADAIRLAELERVRGDFTPEQREAVQAMSKAMFAKLLHDPTVRLKSAAGTPEGDRMADALRALFGV